MALTLIRKVGEAICIGDDITVIVNRLKGNSVSLSIEAPDSVHIIRHELRGTDKPLSVRSASRPDPNPIPEPLVPVTPDGDEGAEELEE